MSSSTAAQNAPSADGSPALGVQSTCPVLIRHCGAEQERWHGPLVVLLVFLLLLDAVSVLADTALFARGGAGAAVPAQHRDRRHRERQIGDLDQHPTFEHR